MSVTAKQVFEICMAFADEIDETGIINPTDTMSYEVRVPGILTSLQTELLKEGEVFKTHEISNYPPKTILGSFDILEFTGEEIIKEAIGQAKGYYFEVDSPCIVYIEDFTTQWNTLATIDVTGINSFTAYKGTVTPTNGSTKSRIRFTGTYRYLITNYCLYPVMFSIVPDYRAWIKKEMPSDFKSISQIVQEYPIGNYDKSPNYKWEGRKDLYINREYRGNIRIVYRPVPSVITTTNDTLEIDDVTALTVLPYALGMELFKEENEDLYKHFRNRYSELKFQAQRKQPVAEETIIDFYGGFS